AGFSNLVNRLDDDFMSRDQVVQALEQSAEHRTITVQDLYRHYLQREADPTGLKAATAFLMAGGSVEQVEAMITSSPEYFQRRGSGSNDGFLAALYQDAFNRPIDSVGQSAFGSALASGI